jgi:hypothetical protein
MSSITLGIAGISVVAFGSVTPGGGVLLFCGLLFITFGCPAVLVWAQKFKKCAFTLPVNRVAICLMHIILVRFAVLGILLYLRCGQWWSDSDHKLLYLF